MPQACPSKLRSLAKEQWLIFLDSNDPHGQTYSQQTETPPPSTAFYGAGFSRTTRLILFSYSARSFLKRLYASACAGDSGLGSLSRSWTPRRICLIVMAGFHASSSLRMERQT